MVSRVRAMAVTAGWFLAATSTVLTVVACCAATAAVSSSSLSSQLDCGTVTSLLSGCAAFVRHSAQLPAPGTPCCDGVAGLYAVAADSADNWRSVCRCMARLVRRHGSNASAIALLPGLCGVVRLGIAAENTNSYCTSFS